MIALNKKFQIFKNIFDFCTASIQVQKEKLEAPAIRLQVSTMCFLLDKSYSRVAASHSPLELSPSDMLP
jgi:hypothetical protein